MYDSCDHDCFRRPRRAATQRTFREVIHRTLVISNWLVRGDQCTVYRVVVPGADRPGGTETDLCPGAAVRPVPVPESPLAPLQLRSAVEYLGNSESTCGRSAAAASSSSGRGRRRGRGRHVSTEFRLRVWLSLAAKEAVLLR